MNSARIVIRKGLFVGMGSFGVLAYGPERPGL